MNPGWGWLILALVATAVGQLTFKPAVVKRSMRLIAVAIAIFCIAPIGAFMALHTLSLATVYVSTAFSQLLVVLGSMVLFKERYVTRQWLGFAVILVGVIVFNFRAFA